MLGNIRLPVIVLAASSPAAGAGANIGVSAVAALAAAVQHIRAGRIDWRLLDDAERYLSGQDFELVRTERDVVTID